MLSYPFREALSGASESSWSCFNYTGLVNFLCGRLSAPLLGDLKIENRRLGPQDGESDLPKPVHIN
jgi:hypothetical protein